MTIQGRCSCGAIVVQHSLHPSSQGQLVQPPKGEEGSLLGGATEADRDCVDPVREWPLCGKHGGR